MRRPNGSKSALNVADGTQIKAIGYVRVSSADQADSGLSLSAQRSKIRAYCTANSWRLLTVHEDAGLSAKSLNRPGLTAALAELGPGRILVALKLDRLTRRVRDLGDITDRIAEAGADWATVQEHYDTTTATGRLILNMIAELAQWEGEVISERTVSALAVIRERGGRLGATPLGYRTVEHEDGTRTAVLDPEEQETVRLIRELRASGLSYRRIGEELTAAGRRTKQGRAWHPATVARTVKSRYLERSADARAD